MNYAVIMAGGTGKRLWPISRQTRPKQVLKLLEGQTLLRRCFERLVPIFGERNIIILTNAGYADLVRENLPSLPYNNVIAEPIVRDTAGAIGLAAAVITKYDADATMAILTADQIIKPISVLQDTIEQAMNFVEANPESLVTFGIEPIFPSTQLGYVKCGPVEKCDKCQKTVYKVDSFKEKPDKETATKYVESGEYFWNSGMFIWKAKTILDNLFNFLPDAEKPLRKIQSDWDSPAQAQTLEDYFPQLPKISIDFAVMEKSEKVFVLKLDCSWFDMGSFAALADIISSDKDRNVVVAGESQLLDCKNSIVVTEDQGHLIAAIGIDNLVVAHSPDATLVCPLNQSHRLKELLELIKKRTGDKFL